MLQYPSFINAPLLLFSPFFFFNDPATTEIYTLSLHDALPIYWCSAPCPEGTMTKKSLRACSAITAQCTARSEEHTSELQSRFDLVCRLLLEKKKKKKKQHTPSSTTHTHPTQLATHLKSRDTHY